MLNILACLVEDVIRGLTGPLGIRLRRTWYSRRFARCGPDLVVGPHVTIVGARWMEIGAHVWIDQSASLIAGLVKNGAADTVRGPTEGVSPGRLRIGDNAHIGIGSIIQGHGGATIGSHFTCGSHAKIYSYSNDQRRCRHGTVRAGDAQSVRIATPVRIGRNVWIGMNAIVVGHTIGDDVFVRPNSVVTRDIAANAVAGGDPALRLAARFEDSV